MTAAAPVWVEPIGPADQRRAVVAEAASWVGTPYVDNGAVKGAGVDCAMLLCKVYTDLGLVPWFDPRPYPMQWSLHQRAERYLETVQGYAAEVAGPPLPGDIALFRFGLTYAHAAIVIDWPRVIHANPPGACRYGDVMRQSDFLKALTKGPARFFSVWAR